MTGRVLGASGFLVFFWVAVSKSKWVQIRATYIMRIVFIESKGDRVEGVYGSRV